MNNCIQLSDQQLHDLQLKNLEIAKYFVGFCIDHDIKIFLCGGACLGTVRHCGFIPWDDDIDFFMLAPDFSKLQELWPLYADVKHYSLCVESRTYNDHHLTPTIRDNYTTFITKETCDTDTNQGVALEIAILNASPDSILGQKIQLILAAGASLFKAQRLPNNQSKGIHIASKILLSIFRGDRIRYFFWSTLEKWSTHTNIKFGESKYVREFTMFPYISWLYPMDWFSEMVFLRFEDTRMPVPKGYREYLAKRYGNYMELPPEKDRHPEHNLIFLDLEESYLKYRGIYYMTEEKRNV